jgi:hypothetical protein
MFITQIMESTIKYNHDGRVSIMYKGKKRPHCMNLKASASVPSQSDDEMKHSNQSHDFHKSGETKTKTKTKKCSVGGAEFCPSKGSKVFAENLRENSDELSQHVSRPVSGSYVVRFPIRLPTILTDVSRGFPQFR